MYQVLHDNADRDESVMSGEYSCATRALLEELDPYGIAGDDLFYELGYHIRALRLIASWGKCDSLIILAIADELELERERCRKALVAADEALVAADAGGSFSWI